MRIDHFAYQRATRVAAFGFLLQVVMGLFLLVFALRTGTDGDTALLFGSIYVLCGVPVWLSLIVVFHQHKLERLEALEEDELAAAREGASTIFEASDEEVRVAARRLRLMHKWMMPAVSVVVALLLAGLAWMMWTVMRAFSATGAEALEVAEFAMTTALGWAVAICLALAAISFIFSRFVAGMAQQAAWQNLRGGAGWMVGNALVLFAIATGVVFRFFDNDQVIRVMAWAVPVFMWLLAAEIGLNLILNFYRPRIPGETPRPAFDSRILSVLAAPDSVVRSINEAVNYQFGFDVTSTWGYQLLIRSVARLLALGLIVMVVLSTMVVVEPYQQAVKLTGGRIAGDRVHDSGLLLKLPWPLQTASIHDVSRVRSLPLTARRTARERQIAVNTWQRELNTDREMEPFLVRRSRLAPGDLDPAVVTSVLGGGESSVAQEQISQDHALVDAEIILQYRVSDEEDGLLDYLKFAPDTIGRRDMLTMREKALQSIALREVSLHLSTLRLDEVFGASRDDLAGVLAGKIQEAFERARAGVEVVAVNIPLLRPSGTAAEEFVDLMMAREDMQKLIAEARRHYSTSMTYLIGAPDQVDEVVARIDRYSQLRNELGKDHPEVLQLQADLDQMLVDLGGNAGQQIAIAETDRWVKLMSTRARSSRVEGQVASYQAAPRLFRERQVMEILKTLAPRRKFILGIDPSRVHMDVEFKELNPILQNYNIEAPDGGSGSQQ